MASSIFGNAPTGKNQGKRPTSFASFVESMKGKDPEKIVKEMLADGRMSRDQFNRLSSQVNGILGSLGRKR